MSTLIIGRIDGADASSDWFVSQRQSTLVAYWDHTRRSTTIHLRVMLALAMFVVGATTGSSRTESRRFPEGFQFGAATASYQVEGAWDEDGRTMSIWDYYTHRDPCVIDDCTNGDIAADSYHQVERDVEMMRELGLDFYRFSISWSRLLPSGFANEINPAGLQYYNNLIDEMLKYNIQPMVTLYHWDLPQRLLDLGGYTNSMMVDWYADYARVVFEQFGDRVKTWITFNEPKQICYEGYGDVVKIPILNIQGIAEYQCARNLLLAHATAWHMYDEEFRPIQHGEIGIAVNIEWYEPLTNSEDDIAAANDYRQFDWGQYIHPIFSENGDFPKEMRENIGVKSAAQGFPKSRLPEFSQQEIDFIRGTSDFLGVNTYSTKFIYRNESTVHSFSEPSYRNDINGDMYYSTEYPQGSSVGMQVIPWGFYNVLTHLTKTFNNPIIYVTESGYAGWPGLQDDDRIYYYRNYLESLLDAINAGSDVRKYTAWSLMDNFEWMRGYTQRFGLYEVDFEDPIRTRTARKSALVYKEIVRSGTIDFEYEPISLDIRIDEGH